MIKTDILIVGGGPVGGTLACLLAQEGLTITVVDREPPLKTLQPEYDGRVSALSLSSSYILEAAGIWQKVKAETCLIQSIKITNAPSPSLLSFHHGVVGSDPMGFMLENRRLRNSLMERAQELPQITWVAPATIERIVPNADGVTVHLSDQTAYHARLLIGADGRSSQVRDLLGIETTSWTYDQTAIVATLHHSEPHQGAAWEKFFSDGPVATLPMNNQRSALVWSCPENLLQNLLRKDEREFRHALEARLDGTLGEITDISHRSTYPLSAQFAHQFYGPGTALVGDAAHAIHPVAGQGLNLGLRDAACLAERIVDAHRAGDPISSPELLKGYHDQRQWDTLTFLLACDGLVRLFSNRSQTLNLLRAWGLRIVNNILPLKRGFVKHAMGLSESSLRIIRERRL